jgi:hypothetical protein
MVIGGAIFINGCWWLSVDILLVAIIVYSIVGHWWLSYW